MQKGFKFSQRSHLDLSWRELHLPKVRSKQIKGLAESHTLSEQWKLRHQSQQGLSAPRVALHTASLAQYEAFLQEVKQCPAAPPAAELQLHYGLTYHEVLCCACPPLFEVCSSSGTVFTASSQKPFENWSQSQAASLSEVFLRGTKWNYLFGKTPPNARVSAGLSIFLVPSDVCSDCHFATVQYITDVFL